jgi:hypothetical protein
VKTRPLRQRLLAWIENHRPLRWVDTIVTDYSEWTPW